MATVVSANATRAAIEAAYNDDADRAREVAYGGEDSHARQPCYHPRGRGSDERGGCVACRIHGHGGQSGMKRQGDET